MTVMSGGPLPLSPRGAGSRSGSPRLTVQVPGGERRPVTLEELLLLCFLTSDAPTAPGHRFGAVPQISTRVLVNDMPPGVSFEAAHTAIDRLTERGELHLAARPTPGRDIGVEWGKLITRAGLDRAHDVLRRIGMISDLDEVPV